MQQQPWRPAAVKHNRLVAIVDRVAYHHAYYDGQFTYIEHNADTNDPHDSGFVLLGDEALELPEIPDERLITVCLHCLIDRHPYVGKGLEAARTSGRVIRDGDSDDWISRTE